MVIREDFVRDEHPLQPIVQAMLKSLGRPRAKVKVRKDPRFEGTGQALKWEWVRQALERYRHLIDLFLLCVDRDGVATRRETLDSLESKAESFLSDGTGFFAENAWQEVEVWLLAGHDLPAEWNWTEIRAEIHPKERFYLPFARAQKAIDSPGQGRDRLGREAARRYDRVRSKCPEDLGRLHSRVEAWLAISRSS